MTKKGNKMKQEENMKRKEKSGRKHNKQEKEA